MSVTYDHTKLTPEENAVVDAILRKNNAIVEPEKENKAWEPKVGEKFYFLHGMGEIIHGTRCNNADYAERYSIGNCFRTKEEAEFAVERLKVIAELRRFAEEHNIKVLDWNNDNQRKYLLYYEHSVNEILINSYTYMHHNDIHFSSEEIAEAAIEVIGEDRLKKYYFCL